MTISPCLVVPQYPVPWVQDLLSELKGGQKFTKLDLSDAYQQVVFAEESRDYVAKNTWDCIGTLDYLMEYPWGQPYVRKQWTRCWLDV